MLITYCDNSFSQVHSPELGSERVAAAEFALWRLTILTAQAKAVELCDVWQELRERARLMSFWHLHS
jgi:hypothetical protein